MRFLTRFFKKKPKPNRIAVAAIRSFDELDKRLGLSATDEDFMTALADQCSRWSTQTADGGSLGYREAISRVNQLYHAINHRINLLMETKP